MRHPWMCAIGLCLAPLAGASAESKGKPGTALPLSRPAEKAACGSHGTSIDFLDTPGEAARQAKKQSKLVFVLHVSGNFEDPRFT
jgi:hypothetical protein